MNRKRAPRPLTFHKRGGKSGFLDGAVRQEFHVQFIRGRMDVQWQFVAAVLVYQRTVSGMPVSDLNVIVKAIVVVLDLRGSGTKNITKSNLQTRVRISEKIRASSANSMQGILGVKRKKVVQIPPVKSRDVINTPRYLTFLSFFTFYVLFLKATRFSVELRPTY